MSFESLKARMPKNSAVSSLVLALLISYRPAHAGDGFVVGSGGGAIVCEHKINSCDLPIPQRSFCEELDFRTPVTQEYFIARSTANAQQSRYMSLWTAKDSQQTEHILLTKLQSSSFLSSLKLIKKAMGTISSRGVNIELKSLDALINFMHDSFLPFELPFGCRQRLVAYRSTNGTVMYQGQLWQQLELSKGASQQAILQMHEWIYHYGKTMRGHANSHNTQKLIVYLLQQPTQSDDLDIVLRNLDFAD